MFVSKENKRKGQDTRNSTKKDNERTEVKCFKCNKVGHYAKYCKKQSNTQKKGNEDSKCVEIAMATSGNVQRHPVDKMEPRYDWCLDSGASSHMCHNQSVFEEIY